MNKVEVKVTLDGSPLADAMVSFTNDAGKSANGQTDSSGIAKMAMTGADKGKGGVEPGSYAVTIEKREKPDIENVGKTDPTAAMKQMKDKDNTPKGVGAGPMGAMPKSGAGPGQFKSLIPEKYNDPKKSGFTVKVPEETGSVKEFKLTSESKSDKK
jgi:hypothetical protein